MMVIHSLIIGIFLYIFMILIGQKSSVAEDRSILISALILVYMVLFGHKLPHSINKNIM